MWKNEKLTFGFRDDNDGFLVHL